MPSIKSGTQFLQNHTNEQLRPMFDTLDDTDTFEEFIDALKVNLESVLLNLEKSGDQYYSLKEEQLNATVASMLRVFGYDVETESSHRGKVDITVKNSNFEWLIEAKIGHNNNYIFEGFLQLTTRYLTNQKSSGLLIYFQNDQPQVRFDEWCDYIDDCTWKKYATSKEILGACTKLFSNCKCTIISSPTEKRAQTDCLLSSGNISNIEFFGVNLYFNPLDKSGRAGKAKMLFHAKRHLIESYLSYKEDGSYGSEEDLFKALDVVFDLDKDLKPLLQSERKKIAKKLNE